MRGSVAEDGSEPLLPLGLLAGVENYSEEGTSLEVEAVIDTGFDGELTLSSRTIRRLGYPTPAVPAGPWPTAARSSSTSMRVRSFGTGQYAR
jgi:hypothetical protein